MRTNNRPLGVAGSRRTPRTHGQTLAADEAWTPPTSTQELLGKLFDEFHPNDPARREQFLQAAIDSAHQARSVFLTLGDRGAYKPKARSDDIRRLRNAVDRFGAEVDRFSKKHLLSAALALRKAHRAALKAIADLERAVLTKNPGNPYGQALYLSAAATLKRFDIDPKATSNKTRARYRKRSAPLFRLATLLHTAIRDSLRPRLHEGLLPTSRPPSLTGAIQNKIRSAACLIEEDYTHPSNRTRRPTKPPK